jgi:hypothetical protein
MHARLGHKKKDRICLQPVRPGENRYQHTLALTASTGFIVDLTRLSVASPDSRTYAIQPNLQDTTHWPMLLQDTSEWRAQLRSNTIEQCWAHTGYSNTPAELLATVNAVQAQTTQNYPTCGIAALCMHESPAAAAAAQAAALRHS